MKKTYLQKGFTLIELLVVIAIIGILSAVVLGSLSTARNKATRTAAVANSRGVMTELALCASDNGTVAAPTSSGGGGGVICTATPAHTVTWPVPTTGWAYGIGPTQTTTPTSGTIAGGNVVFSLYKSGETTITCSMVTNACN